MYSLPSVKGGIHYSKLDEKQKNEVAKFYGRKMVKAELNYSYHFDANGKCVSAS